jgi:hypothetical protein
MRLKSGQSTPYRHRKGMSAWADAWFNTKFFAPPMLLSLFLVVLLSSRLDYTSLNDNTV